MQEFYTQEQNTQKGKFLTFHLANEVFALEIRYVTEIYNMLSIVPLPGTPEYIKGIINLRGKIIPVIDMRLKLQKTAEAYTDRTCIIILNVEGAPCGLVVDSVAEVCSIRDDDIEPLPEMKCFVMNHYLKGIAKVSEELAMILDCKVLLMQEQLSDLTHLVS